MARFRDIADSLTVEQKEQMRNDASFDAAITRLRNVPPGPRWEDAAISIIGHLCNEIKAMQKQNEQLLMSSTQPILISKRKENQRDGRY